MKLDKIRLPAFTLVLLVVVVIALSLSGWRRTDLRPTAARPGVADLALNDAERQQCMDQAAAGSAAAAYRLALYYQMCRLDYANGEQWLKRADDLGHAGAHKWLKDIAERRRRDLPETEERAR